MPVDRFVVIIRNFEFTVESVQIGQRMLTGDRRFRGHDIRKRHLRDRFWHVQRLKARSR